MTKMIKIRTSLHALLQSIHPRVYYEQAPDNAAYPFLVYDLPNSVNRSTMDNFVLEIDAWDNSTDTTVLETLIDTVDRNLDKYTAYSDGLSITFYNENKRTIRDPDKRLRRRQYVYQARVYGR